MATQVISNPRLVKSRLNHGNQAFAGGSEANYFKEAASQSFLKGDLVYLASGKLTICTYTGGANSNLHNSRIAGQALADAEGVTDTVHHIKVIRPDDIYAANVYHATLGSAVSAQTQLGLTYGLRRVSNKVVVAIEETVQDATYALGRVKVVGFADPVGDTYGRLLVQFVNASAASDSNPVEVNILQLG